MLQFRPTPTYALALSVLLATTGSAEITATDEKGATSVETTVAPTQTLDELSGVWIRDDARSDDLENLLGKAKSRADRERSGGDRPGGRGGRREGGMGGGGMGGGGMRGRPGSGPPQDGAHGGGPGPLTQFGSDLDKLLISSDKHVFEVMDARDQVWTLPCDGSTATRKLEGGEVTGTLAFVNGAWEEHWAVPGGLQFVRRYRLGRDFLTVDLTFSGGRLSESVTAKQVYKRI